MGLLIVACLVTLVKFIWAGLGDKGQRSWKIAGIFFGLMYNAVLLLPENVPLGLRKANSQESKA